MSREAKHKRLTMLFRLLGASDPDACARSQLDEGIDHLSRLLFLREAWKNVVPDGDRGWIGDRIEQARKRPDEPFAGTGQALVRLRDHGASDEDLTDLVRGMQAELLFDLCSLIDGGVGDLEPELEDVSWRLVRVDDADNVVGAVEALHESVLKMDPTRREMRPRDAAATFKELDVVIVRDLLRPTRQIDGTEGVMRQPRLGDQGAVVHVLSPQEYAVECVDAAGMTVWLGHFGVNEIALSPPGWQFSTEKISQRLHRAQGVGPAGFRVEATDADPTRALATCYAFAARNARRDNQVA